MTGRKGESAAACRNRVQLFRSLRPGENIRRAGENIAQGDSDHDARARSLVRPKSAC